MPDKKQKRRWGLMLFLVIIMIGTSFSVFLFGGSPQSDVVRYNGIKFVSNNLQGKLWIASINGKQAAFSFLPEEVKDIKEPDELYKKFQDKIEIDVTYDLNNTYKESIALSQHQMGITLSEYGIFLRKGLTENSTFSLPIITCKDATANVPVVYFKSGNSTRIYLDNDCVIAEASTNIDFIKAKDRLLYAVLGVMK